MEWNLNDEDSVGQKKEEDKKMKTRDEVLNGEYTNLLVEIKFVKNIVSNSGEKGFLAVFKVANETEKDKAVFGRYYNSGKKKFFVRELCLVTDVYVNDNEGFKHIPEEFEPEMLVGRFLRIDTFVRDGYTNIKNIYHASNNNDIIENKAVDVIVNSEKDNSELNFKDLSF